MRKKSFYSWGLFILLIFSIFGELSLLEIYLTSSDDNSLNISENSQSFYDVPRLRSDQPVFQNESIKPTEPLNSWTPSISERNHSSNSTEFSSGGKFSLPLLQLNGDPDLNITKISPEAMEKNASSMTFILNFSIPGEIGLGIGTLVNLTLNNVSDNLLITSYTPSDWVELTNETGFFIDQYSLTFILNNTFLASIAFGSYDLIMYTNVSGYLSSDSIPLPMRDVWVEIGNVNPAEFNNRLDTDQYFSVEVEVKNYTSTSTFYWVDFLPVVLDANGTNINPRAIVKSASDVGFLNFEGFIVNNTSLGRFTLNFSLPASVAQDFEEDTHQLIVSVTTLEWISDNASIPFEAKGTIYHVILEELTVENNPPLDYDTLTAGTQDDIIFRLNVNDSINITFYVYDTEQQTNSTRVHDIQYQDPNKPEDPTALFSKSTNDVGVGSITLTANDVTYSGGYTLLFFVRGHRTSQETERPSNITIFWDLLYFEYTYYDNQGTTGSSTNPNQKALGVDVNESWTLELGLYYASDDTNAFGGNISYRFGGSSIWNDLTDGSNGDPLDGLFNISYMHQNASEVLFECQIISGSSFDPQGTLFVNKTVGATEFNLTVTWTYLIIEMIPGELDQRLSTLTPTYIYLNATWAHNATLAFNGLIVVKDHFWNTQKPVILSAGEGNLTGLVHINNGSYLYSVVDLDDDFYGVTKFTNSSIVDIENPLIQVDIIWESIIFTYSNIYNPSNPPNQSIESFFANHGENGSLYVYGRHSYDNSPFNGTAVLYAFEIAKPYTLVFINGVANWTDDLTEHGFEISFGIMEIYEDTDYGVISVGTYESVIISWDKIVITLEANQTYSHGTWANISVIFSYLVFDIIPVDPNNVTYSILLSNETSPRVDVSWQWFLDFSLGPASRTYNITDIFDSSTGLSKAEVRYKWLDRDMDTPVLGNLTIYWIDDKDSTIVELRTYDLGNGSIIIVLDAIDDSENWIGSGIAKVELFDERELVQRFFPQNASYVLLPSGIHRYYFKYSYNQLIEDYDPPHYFRFEFGDTLRFYLRITEYGTPNFPAHLRSPRIIITDTFTVTTNYDLYRPEFISKNGTDITVFYPKLDETLTTIPTITDGDVIVTVYIQDSMWSGINRSFVQLIVVDMDNDINYTRLMTINDTSIPRRDESQFNWAGNLDVGGTYRLTVIIMDRAGNINSRTVEETIRDYVAPRVIDVTFDEKDDRRLEIIIEIEEGGFGVDYVTIGIITQGTQGKIIQWYNLSKQGGGGSGLADDPRTEVYSIVVSLPFDLLDIFGEKRYSLNIIAGDKAKNEKFYSERDLKELEIDFEGSFDRLILHPIVFVTGAILLIFGIIVGIRITSKVEGYDMKRIFTEGEKISREVILTQMDEYALGVTVNFFDQVQGPVPVIWEPALLEDQEQVMLDLSDKSFSTLEFIGLEETERSGTFDFSTGSYDCTALGYSFAVPNPKARGGKENLTIVLLLRKEWGDNLLIFQDELTDKLREIREMIETQQHASQIEKKARELREFVSRLMLSFNKIYTGIDYEVEFQEE